MMQSGTWVFVQRQALRQPVAVDGILRDRAVHSHFLVLRRIMSSSRSVECFTKTMEQVWCGVGCTHSLPIGSIVLYPLVYQNDSA